MKKGGKDMKWYPWGKYAKRIAVKFHDADERKVNKNYIPDWNKEWIKHGAVEIGAYKNGCANGKCVHIRMDIATTPADARRIAQSILKASDYAETH